jgi:Tfp pilus assembly protein PilP
LVQDPSGDSYIIAEGARIGRNEGFVTAIDDNMLRVREKYIDSVGHETMKDIELSMRRNEGG